MSPYRIIAKIAAAIAAGEAARTLSDRQIASIEQMLASLGQFTAEIDEPLPALERALARLRIRNAASDVAARAAAYARVKEYWREVEPVLSHHASGAGTQTKG